MLSSWAWWRGLSFLFQAIGRLLAAVMDCSLIGVSIEQFSDRFVEVVLETLVIAWRGYAVTPGGIVNSKLTLLDVRDFELVVGGLEIEIVIAGDDSRSGLDCTQCRFKDALIGWLFADIALLPGLEFAQQIVGIPIQMILFPVLE